MKVIKHEAFSSSTFVQVHVEVYLNIAQDHEPFENAHIEISLKCSLLASFLSFSHQITSTTKAVFDMMSQTLLSLQASHLSCDIVAMTKDALQQLIDEGLVVQKRSLSQGEEIDHKPNRCIGGRGGVLVLFLSLSKTMRSTIELYSRKLFFTSHLLIACFTLSNYSNERKNQR